MVFNWDLKLEEKNYITLNKNEIYDLVVVDEDKELTSDKYGDKINLYVEGVNLSTNEDIKGIWSVRISTYTKSVYGQLQTIRQKTGTLVGKKLRVSVIGNDNMKRYTLNLLE